MMLVPAVLSYRHAVCHSIIIFLSSFFVGGSLITAHLSSHKRSFPTYNLVYDAVVSSVPVTRGKVVMCDIMVTSMRRPFKIKASILGDDRALSLRPGDGITAVSVMNNPRNYAKSRFDYKRYLVHHGYSGQTFIYKTDWHKARADVHRLPYPTRVRLVALKYRERLLAVYRRLGIGGDAFAVVSAMTLGVKESMPGELRERYSAAGASHILALSGLHIGIIYAVLSFFFVWRRFRVSGHLLALSAVWAYVFVTGMPPSAVRSAVMVSIYAVATVCFRERMSLNVLSAAAFAMLSVCPSDLFDVGFQMSFAAVFFIIVFYRRIYGSVPLRWRSNIVTSRLWQMTAVSLAAQAGVAPLVVLCFGRVSLYFLLANLVVIPAAALILYGALLLFAFSSIPVIQCIVVSVLLFVVEHLNTFVEYLSTLPGGDISGVAVSPVQVWMIYALVFVVYGLSDFARKALFSGRTGRT